MRMEWKRRRFPSGWKVHDDVRFHHHAARVMRRFLHPVAHLFLCAPSDGRERKSIRCDSHVVCFFCSVRAGESDADDDGHHYEALYEVINPGPQLTADDSFDDSFDSDDAFEEAVVRGVVRRTKKMNWRN